MDARHIPFEHETSERVIPVIAGLGVGARNGSAQEAEERGALLDE